MKNMKDQMILSIVTFVAILETLCFAVESIPRKAEGETVSPPSKLLDIHRSDFSNAETLHVNDPNADRRTTHLMLMTNVVRSITQTRYLVKEDVAAGVFMVNRLLESCEVKTDRDAVLCLLSGISTMHSVSTNEYALEFKIADEADAEFQRERRRRPGSLSVVSQYRGPNAAALEEKWMPIFEHNRNCSELRSRLVNAVAASLPSLNKSLKAKDFEVLLNVITKAGGFTDEEKKIILSAQPLDI